MVNEMKYSIYDYTETEKGCAFKINGHAVVKQVLCKPERSSRAYLFAYGENANDGITSMSQLAFDLEFDHFINTVVKKWADKYNNEQVLADFDNWENDCRIFERIQREAGTE